MQRKYSEPNAYIDNLPRGRMPQEELYDDVDLPDVPEVRCPARHPPAASTATEFGSCCCSKHPRSLSQVACIKGHP